MKISILGTNGFLSTAIAKYGSKNNWIVDIYGLDTPTGHSYNRFVQVNLMDKDMDCFTLLDSDMVVYAIGAGIQSNLKEGFDLIYKLNVTAPVQVCNKLKELDYKGCFVTFGSVFEMGETCDERFFTEKDVLTSICPCPNDYIVSKRMLSRFVAGYKHEFTHWHFYIPTIYGETENPQRLIPYTINALRNNVPLHLTAGSQTRQYIYVGEVPRLLDLSYQKGLPSGLYNIEGCETLTVKEIVTLIHQVMGKEISKDCFGTAQRVDTGMTYLALDGKKLREATGFEACIKITDIINRY